MASLWIGYARTRDRASVSEALSSVSPRASISFVATPSGLREALRDEEPYTVGAIVGPCDEGVSDVNLAAALAHDGRAREVALATRDASGSLRSRALQAGITRVIDMPAVPFGAGVPLVLSVPEREQDASEQVLEQELGADFGPAQVIDAVGASVPGGPAIDVVPTREGGSPVITLVSGRGGVGKTTVCALMATLAGAWGLSVALLDLDLSSGNLASRFPTARGSDLSELVDLKGAPFADAVRQSAVSCAENVQLWGPVARPELAETVMPLAPSLIGELRRMHDLVLIDTSTTCTDGVAQAMQEADRLVCVQGQGAGAIASLSRTSALAVRLGVARTRIVRVENFADQRAWGRPFEPRVELGLETARAFRVVEGSSDVMELIAAGEIGGLVSLEDEFTRSAATLLGCLLKELGRLPDAEDAQRAAEGAFVRKTFSLFGRRREAV